MAVQRQLRCLIAAGGTAGHVLPALAVADALTERGVLVTFAGSPDRVEARLVPEAGYELDTFRDHGAPAPAVDRARARRSCSRARRRARAGAILRSRRPDVVLGGGGFVAGPMVFAASTMRIPAALTEADAHLGLANRLAAPFARRLFLAYPVETRWRAKSRVVGRPIPARSRRGAAGRRRARSSSCRPTGRCSASSARSRARKSLNEFVVETWGEQRAGDPARHRRARLRARASPRRASRLPRDLRDRSLRRRDLRRRPGARAFRRRSVWEIAAAGRPAILVPYPFATGDHQALNAEHFVRAGGAIMVRELDLDDVPELVRSLLDDRRAAGGDGRGDAARGAARRGRRDRGRAGRAWPGG